MLSYIIKYLKANLLGTLTPSLVAFCVWLNNLTRLLFTSPNFRLRGFCSSLGLRKQDGLNFWGK